MPGFVAVRGWLGWMLRVLGTLVVVGGVAGLAWWLTTPRTEAYFAAGMWYNPDHTAFWVRQDVGFAVCTGLAGLAVSVWLLRGVRRRQHLVWRFVVTLASSAVGTCVAWGVGVVVGSHPHPAQGQMGTAALQLHALGLLALWPAIVSLATAVTLLWVTWTTPEDLPEPPAGAPGVEHADVPDAGPGAGPRIAP